MKLFKSNTAKSVAIGIMCAALIVGGMFTENLMRPPVAQAQGNPALTVSNPNIRYAAMVFTATSQTLKQTVGGESTASVEITGTATSCILQIKGTSDGGTNYFAIPYWAGVYTSNVPVIITGAAFPTYNNAPVLYWVNLAGLNGFEVVSSSTFTGTSCTVNVVASSNKGVL